ncbi:hypothetical protein [Gemmatimonas sp.]|jgi:hypothetical protein|uniref:hypothetical protein n=1 Tax=Gemmatimonas sp. TaxID=1962908 RepID=UPI0037C0620C
MYLDVYVGRLDDPDFVANRNKPGGAVPGAESRMFPNGSSAFYELVRRIETKQLPGGATQHIAYVAHASKEQIAEFFETMISEDLFLRPDTPTPHLINEAEELRAWIAAMEDDGQWCLVASEL